VKVFVLNEDFERIVLIYYHLLKAFKYDRAFQIFQKVFDNFKIAAQKCLSLFGSTIQAFTAFQ